MNEPTTSYPSDHASVGEAAGPHRRFEQLFTAIDEGYCLCEIVVDAADQPVDYRFLETNPLFEEMTGLADAVGRTARELVPDLEQHWVDVYARAALGGERIRFQQGSEAMGRWFDVFTMPIEPRGRFAIVFKDESARHLAEEALQASERRYRDLAAQEHENSLRLQHALLPARLHQHPQFTIAARYEAVAESDAVGGDWYDTFVWPDGRLGLMVGDVAGHNLDAAATMGHLRAGAAALAPHTASSPAAWLDALDECARGPNGADYVTAAAVVIDPGSATVTSSLAGHPAPLLVTPGGQARWLASAKAPPMGALFWADRSESSTPIEPGSIVVLYSDGLVERRGVPIDQGLARLEQVAIRHRDAGPEELSGRLMGEVTDGRPEDDVVVLVARYDPSRRRPS